MFARQQVEIFKPAIDTRYSEAEVVSHDNNSIKSTPVETSASILLLGSEIDVVGIDEAQFFDEGLIGICNELANRGYGLSSPVWIWITKVFLSVRYPDCVP